MRSHEFARMILAKPDCEIVVIDPEFGGHSEPVLNDAEDFSEDTMIHINEEVNAIYQQRLKDWRDFRGKTAQVSPEERAVIEAKYVKEPILTIR